MKPQVVLVTKDSLVKIENDAPIVRHFKLLPNERIIVITLEQPMAFTYARVLATPDDAIRFSDPALESKKELWAYALQQKGTLVIELSDDTLLRYVYLDKDLWYYQGTQRTCKPLLHKEKPKISADWIAFKTVKNSDGEVQYFSKKKKKGVAVKSVSY